MEQIPFFPKLIICGSIISGLFLFILSFSSKQRTAMIESLGESGGRKAHLLPEFCTQISAMNTLLQFYIFAAVF